MKYNNFDPSQTMRSKNFEINLYKDSYLKQVALHHHDFYEIYYLIKGTVKYRIDNYTYDLKPGDFLLINPMELHEPILNENKSEYLRMVLWLDKSFIKHMSADNAQLLDCFNNFDKTNNNLLRFNTELRSDLANILAKIYLESETGEFGQDIFCSSLITIFLVMLNRNKKNSNHYKMVTDKNEELVSNVLDYINLNYSQNITLDKISEAFYINKYYMCHEFKKLVGTSIYSYIIQKRLLVARHLILSGEPPKTACLKCGFSDYTNFYKAFKKEYKVTPSSIKKI